MQKSAASLAAIMGQKEGCPDLPEIADQSLGINGPSFWTLIAAKDGLFSGAISSPASGLVKYAKKCGILSRD